MLKAKGISTILSRSLVLLKNNEKRCISNVGFIGVGQMGSRMARNLLKKGFNLNVFDTNAGAVTEAVKLGAKKMDSIAEISQKSNVIITMLPNNQIVLDCYTKDDGIFKNCQENALLIDSSTVDPSVPKTLLEKSLQHKCKYIDAPVSGGVVGAENATLVFMVGGDKQHFTEASPVMEAMGSKLVHCGDIGMGCAAKLCNNMLLAISMIGTAEAFNLGRNLGLDPKLFNDIVNSSTGRCWSTEIYNPVPGILPNVPSSNNYEGGFSAPLVTKDLGLAQDAASRSDSPIPLGSMAHQIYKTICVGTEYSNKDFSVVYQYLKGKK